MSKWKKKYDKALWVKAFGSEAPKKVGRKVVKAISNRLRTITEEYVALKKIWWRRPENRICALCKKPLGPRNREVHHVFGRVGRLLTYTPWWKPLCFKCHSWVHENIAEARDLGLICPIGQWNKQPPK